MFPALKEKVTLNWDEQTQKFIRACDAQTNVRVPIKPYAHTPFIPRHVNVNDVRWPSHRYALALSGKLSQKDNYRGFTLLPTANGFRIDTLSRSLNGPSENLTNKQRYIVSQQLSWGMMCIAPLDKLYASFLLWIENNNLYFIQECLKKRSDFIDQHIYVAPNILHIALQKHCSPEMLAILNQLFDERHEQLSDILSDKNLHGQTVIDISVKNADFYKTTWQWFKLFPQKFNALHRGALLLHLVNKQKTNDAMELLTYNDDIQVHYYPSSNNVFHLALKICQGDYTLLTKLTKCFSHDTLGVLLTQPNADGDSPLALAMKQKRYNLVKYWSMHYFDAFKPAQMAMILNYFELSKQNEHYDDIVTAHPEIETTLRTLRRELRQPTIDFERISRLCARGDLMADDSYDLLNQPLAFALEKKNTQLLALLLPHFAKCDPQNATQAIYCLVKEDIENLRYIAHLPIETNEERDRIRDIIERIINESTSSKNILALIRIIEAAENPVIRDIHQTNSYHPFPYTWKNNVISVRFATLLNKSKGKNLSAFRSE